MVSQAGKTWVGRSRSFEERNRDKQGRLWQLRQQGQRHHPRAEPPLGHEDQGPAECPVLGKGRMHGDRIPGLQWVSFPEDRKLRGNVKTSAHLATGPGELSPASVHNPHSEHHKVEKPGTS